MASQTLASRTHAPVPITRSKEIRTIFRQHVDNPVRHDARSQPSVDIFLGYPSPFTLKRVLRWGLADFSKGFTHATYGMLSADDLVLLYCYFNMKRHFDTASTVFRMHQATLEGLFSADGGSLSSVDIGCGPATACLALADLFRWGKLAYVGIDSAVPMRNKALLLWQAAQRVSLIGVTSTVNFAPSWEEIRVEQPARRHQGLPGFLLLLREPQPDYQSHRILGTIHSLHCGFIRR